ncbi:MAG: hypothetical protein ACRDSN_02330 [Pseudonocardiaceae bacterium]
MSRTRKLTAAFAIGRLAFGVGLLASPEKVASGWLGDDARRGPVKIVVRAVGARDIALSAGALATLRNTDALRLWLGGGVLSDLCDVVSTLVTPGSVLPGNARWGTVALGGGSALAGAALIAAVDR